MRVERNGALLGRYNFASGTKCPEADISKKGVRFVIKLADLAGMACHVIGSFQL